MSDSQAELTADIESGDDVVIKAAHAILRTGFGNLQNA